MAGQNSAGSLADNFDGEPVLCDAVAGELVGLSQGLGKVAAHSAAELGCAAPGCFPSHAEDDLADIAVTERGGGVNLGAAFRADLAAFNLGAALEGIVAP